MSKNDTGDLLRFLQPFGKQITKEVMFLRSFVWAAKRTKKQASKKK
jgi:hypothetical protein